VHNNFFFLAQLTERLKPLLTGTIISECFSQNKDELVIRFETHSEPFFLKASLGGGHSHLSFPSTFQRAKKNSIDLFEEVIGYRVMGIRQFLNERSFALLLEENKTLLFQMHGNRSNIIGLEDDKVVNSFRSNVTVTRTITLDQLDRKIDWTYETFVQRIDELPKVYFTFGKLVWLYLDVRGFGEMNTDGKWDLIRQTLDFLRNPSYFIVRIKGTPHLSLLPFPDGEVLKGDEIEVANTFFSLFTRLTGIDQEKNRIVSLLKTRIRGSETYYQKNFEKLAEIEKEHNYKLWADLLMANLHAIRQGTESVSLPDFYQPGHLVDIKLKKDLSPQANAALFYRKGKNQHVEIERIQSSLQTKEREIDELKRRLELAHQLDDLKALRSLFAELQPEKQGASDAPLPYHEFTHSGFRILVGRNAQQNDELTFRYGYKEDLWLHAKDVSGSHVLIKYQSGKPFPKDVIERAAQIAAYNSKRKTETLCPVIVTTKKWIRKRKGDPPGAVVVEREQVLLVEPKLISDF
jgi:predicted ribosome quality control (RQC) complex YloA/Tae2 family protein